MDKPISLRINDLKTDIVASINKSRLPLVLVRYVMQDMERSVAELQMKQDDEERRAWESEQAEEKELDDLIERIPEGGED